ncbi:hypothetical protein [Pseudomonas cerasi]|uniref:Uncharacterized protein n=1 Tax=Pseudomonas cerasi TaxID=1583341 RepID=A0A193SRX8_9PSED|nr:hypothetical protein [Pseudomonas cerasi]CZT29849.1 hypothetical protein PCPL58_3393 [Pseudomonas cerasi]SOS21570.1 hypothetical protein PL963_03480 [Pseudomonas cerasi]
MTKKFFVEKRPKKSNHQGNELDYVPIESKEFHVVTEENGKSLAKHQTSKEAQDDCDERNRE